MIQETWQHHRGFKEEKELRKVGVKNHCNHCIYLAFREKLRKKVWTTEIVFSLWLTMPRVSGLVLKSGMVTQLPITEFFLGCIYTKDPLDRSVPPPTHAHAYSTSLPQTSDNATIYSPSSTSRTSDRHVLHHGSTRAAPLCATATRSRGSNRVELLAWDSW